ncbi:hypothetical protein K0M31_005725 [Melipona bicolor]|uniref:Uncharacterized protein n=1 Tax=Melipona bicolor TaxID=60889 RepID=A0AA40KM21_9HYME|nr:hypothetical protein K0M31_005725 [Melipona bicolor]
MRLTPPNLDNPRTIFNILQIIVTSYIVIEISNPQRWNGIICVTHPTLRKGKGSIDRDLIRDQTGQKEHSLDDGLMDSTWIKWLSNMIGMIGPLCEVGLATEGNSHVILTNNLPTWIEN